MSDNTIRIQLDDEQMRSLQLFCELKKLGSMERAMKTLAFDNHFVMNAMKDEVDILRDLLIFQQESTVKLVDVHRRITSHLI